MTFDVREIEDDPEVRYQIKINAALGVIVDEMVKTAQTVAETDQKKLTFVKEFMTELQERGFTPAGLVNNLCEERQMAKDAGDFRHMTAVTKEIIKTVTSFQLSIADFLKNFKQVNIQNNNAGASETEIELYKAKEALANMRGKRAKSS